MFTNIVKCFVAALCGLLAACAVITVNVYFPEKDVKQAYKSLDEMLLKQGGETRQPAEGQPAGGEEKMKEEVKPQSSLSGKRFNMSLVAVADAAENMADELAVETSSMPEVLKAYDDLRALLPRLNALRESGAVGENKQGLISIRDQGKLGGNEAVVKAMNDSRKVVITGMAKALQKITERKEPGAKVNLNDLMGKAAATFADVRREEAKPGCWIELSNGRWVQK
jgi:hypothetical protein